MTDEIFVMKIIKKAEDNGYEIPEYNRMFFLPHVEFEYPFFSYSEDFVGMWNLYIYEIIFDHNFAKAFWKQKTPKKCKYCGHKGGRFIMVELGCHFGAEEKWKECSYCKGKSMKKDYIWEMRLREMVLTEEPLKYLERFL